MENLINLVVTNLSEIAITGLVALASYLLTMLGNKMKQVFDNERIKNIVENTVDCINQAYETLSNEEKYEEAKKEILDWLKTEGLKITESQLKILIESAVSKAKK